MLIFLLVSSSSAFDDERQGFVLGFGLGFAPMVSTAQSGSHLSNASPGISVSFLAGWAWNNKNMIAFLHDGVLYRDEESWRGTPGEAKVIGQGFTGVGYYHFFRRYMKSYFLTGGIGIQDWTYYDTEEASNDFGPGILIGGGYMFRRHWHFYGSLSSGISFAPDTEGEYTHVQMSCGVSVMMY